MQLFTLSSNKVATVPLVVHTSRGFGSSFDDFMQKSEEVVDCMKISLFNTC